MIKSVENRITSLDGKTVDVVDVKFESGKGLKLVFDENEEHYFYDAADEVKL